MSEIRTFVLLGVIVCVAVGSFTAYMMYSEDWRQTAAWHRAVACQWEPGTDDSPISAFGAIAMEFGKNFLAAFFLSACIMWLVAARMRPWLMVSGGLLATVFACDVSKAWMFPIVFGGGFGALVNVGVYGWNGVVGKRRRCHKVQPV